MGAELLKMADGFLLVAEGLRALAGQTDTDAGEKAVQEDKAEKNTEKSTEKNTDGAKAEKKEKAVEVEDIRAVLAQKSQDGKSKEIKELLGKYGVAKLSAVRTEDYPALFQEAKVL